MTVYHRAARKAKSWEWFANAQVSLKKLLCKENNSEKISSWFSFPAVRGHLWLVTLKKEDLSQVPSSLVTKTAPHLPPLLPALWFIITLMFSHRVHQGLPGWRSPTQGCSWHGQLRERDKGGCCLFSHDTWASIPIYQKLQVTERNYLESILTKMCIGGRRQF